MFNRPSVTMNNQPLASVITIFLDAEAFLREAIESVLAQTYENWELLLVDDGSTDASSAIAKCYAERYPTRVRYLEHAGHQNCGKSVSRNLGIQQAHGDYIALLDADDVLLPDKLEQQVGILEAHPEAGMVYGPTLYWYSWTGNPADNRRDKLAKLGVQPETLFSSPELLTRFLRDSGMVPCTCGLLARRSIIERVGGFDETIQYMYEDQVFLAKMCLAAPVFVTGVCSDRYRQHPNSTSNQAIQTGEYHPTRPNRARYAFLTWLAAYLEQQGIQDVALWKALHQAFWPYRHPAAYHLLDRAHQVGRRLRKGLEQSAKDVMPSPLRHWYARYRPALGRVPFSDLRRVTPVSREFGYDRGLPIDRYYIERFLARHAADVHGRVLEIGDDSYMRRFGGGRVTRHDVLHVNADNPLATFVGDLTHADHLPSDSFDCFILTQTLHLVYDVRAALRSIYRILRPGGVVLATFPGISQISNDQWADYWHWSFTTLSARRLFEEFFPTTHVTFQAFGNVRAATAFLQGLAAEELRQPELDYQDPQYEVVIAVRAMKPRVVR
jgi:glycosyltransferase involved in cell wall biosynthesis